MPVRNFRPEAALGLCCALGACGGGGGSTANPVTYPFVIPAVGSQRLYTRTTVDNSNNSIVQSLQHTVTAVNPGGNFVYTSEDPNHETVVVDGTNYSIPTESVTANGSGQDLSYTIDEASGSEESCTEDPHGAGPDYPVSVGMSWTLAFTVACGGAAGIAYDQSGTVVDLETVTVPAGTFTALKLQSTIVWTDSLGGTRTESITNWRDASSGLSIKQVIAYTWSGPTPAGGYAVSETLVLE